MALNKRTPVHKPKTTNLQRKNPHRRGYSRRWRNFRDWYLDLHPVCEICKKCNGAQATLVDHIVPLSAGGAHCDANNSQSACQACHNWKTQTQDVLYA